MVWVWHCLTGVLNIFYPGWLSACCWKQADIDYTVESMKGVSVTPFDQCTKHFSPSVAFWQHCLISIHLSCCGSRILTMYFFDSVLFNLKPCCRWYVQVVPRQCQWKTGSTMVVYPAWGSEGLRFSSIMYIVLLLLKCLAPLLCPSCMPSPLSVLAQITLALTVLLDSLTLTYPRLYLPLLLLPPCMLLLTPTLASLLPSCMLLPLPALTPTHSHLWGS